MSLHLALKHTARPNVLSLKRDQILTVQAVTHAIKQTIRLTQSGTIQCIADRAGIGEEGELAASGDVFAEGLNGIATESIVLILKQ